MAMQMHWVYLLAAALLLPCRALSFNRTIDDTDSNAWSFSSSWHAIADGHPCQDCVAKPDRNRVYNYSWHDGALGSGSFRFQGTQVYIYGIDVPRPGNITFTIDDPPSSSSYFFDSGTILYESLFFHAQGLDGAKQHTVNWSVALGPGGGGSVLLDYAVVTVNQTETGPASPTSKLKVGPIVGGVVAGVVALAILVVGLLCYLKARRRRQEKALSVWPDGIELGSDTTISTQPMLHAHADPTILTAFPAPTPNSIPPPSISKAPKGYIVRSSPTSSDNASPPSSPPRAHNTDSEVERRLRALEDTVQGPPPGYN
ncbi:hypothetical protein MIND_00149700 [Mycena indigotica]|uniref:Uncharacterized protein n=1 Tax=Mycena indigotica TaxID=2126181 RepID=A0A8H6TCJ6_9AGAR|nr:uncharacterized protein MIND_00149700 [Mycena indigotica]KAF7316310.1 hypothetical protein MIND_00149700 [Mycena indigotica]